MKAAARVLAAAAFAAIPVTPAQSAETITFQAPNASDDLKELLRNASLVRQMRQDGVDDPQELVAAARAEYGRLLGVLYAQGYYSGTISVLVDGREAADLSPFEAPSTIRQIVVRVEPGPEFRFGKAEVAPLAPGTTLPSGFATGQVAQAGLIREAAQAGVDGWRNVGHAKAGVAGQNIVARHPASRLDAEIALDPGPALRFGTLKIRGEERVRPARIRTISGYPLGEVYNPQELEDAANRLRRVGAFRSVSFTEAEEPNPDGTLDFVLDVVEEKRRRLGIGLQASTTEGGQISAFWLHRNLLGGAEQFRVDALISGIGGFTGGADYNLGVSYTRPASYGPDTDLTIDASVFAENEPDYTAQGGAIGVGATRFSTEDLTLRIGLRFEYSHVEDDFGSNDYLQLKFPINATWDTRDNLLDPSRGYFLNATVTPYLGLDDTVSGTFLQGDARTYLGFADKGRFILAARGQFATFVGPTLIQIPPDERLYSGGGGTVRGQPYESLGVTLTENGVTGNTGGAGFLGASLEARARVTDSIGLVGFYDWGYVSEQGLFDNPQGDSQAGAGIGLRYFTSIGPVRFDVAYPVGPSDTGDGIQLYIGIGQAF